MRKFRTLLLPLVASAAMLCAGVTVEPQPERLRDEASILKAVNDRLAREFISHDGLLLDYVGEIPTPEEIAALKPNAMGWWCPIENGSMFTGEWLPALMAEGPSRKALVETCVRGLIKMSEVSDVPGFIARGTGTDGRSHHPCGSNDQTDPWFLGLCEYCRWPHADAALKAKALERLVFVARALERNAWGVPCDGPFKGQDRGNLNAKAMPFWGKSRLLYALKSLERLTGDRHWGEVYDGLKASALAEIEEGGEIDMKVFRHCYGAGVWIYLSSAQALQRLVEMEENPADRARLRRGLLRYAERVAPLMKAREKYGNTVERPFKYANWRTGYAWRVQKTQKEAEAVARSGKKEILGTRKAYEREGMANPLAAAAVCALTGEAKFREEILATLRHYDYSTPNVCEFFHAAIAAAAADFTCGKVAPGMAPLAPRGEKRIVGYMLDVSRFRVPTMETIRRQVDLLAGLGYNHLQLYTEHTFAYSGCEAAWREASPFTPEEIRELDAYCADRGIELVPNQNSFGHLEHWLKHPEFNHLAEAPQAGTSLGGTVRAFPSSLCPTDPESVTFVAGLFDELLPCFKSKFVNIGGDETVDLLDDGKVLLGRSAAAIREKGAHRVYVDFLKRLHGLVTARGHEMMFWGDIVLQRPELVPELPKDLIALDWGYESDHPFARETETLRKTGLRFVVCPGTSTWCSLLGRTEVMMANIDNAIENGARNGAMGALLTDWEICPNPWSCSLPAIVYFAHRVRGEKLSEAELAAAVDKLVGCRAGESMIELGKIYRKVAPYREDGGIYSTSLRHLLALAERYPWGKNGSTREAFRAALGDWRRARARADLTGAPQWLRDDFAVIDLLEKAVAMRVEEPRKPNFTAIIEPDYRRLWLRQSRPGGLSQTIDRYFHSRSGLPSAAMPTLDPKPRQSRDTWGWWKRCGEKRNAIRDCTNGWFDVVFVGDSITHFWERHEKGPYGDVRGEFSVLNLGFAGDRTENVLWRFREAGHLQGYRAKLFMLMIGINNFGSKPTCSPGQVAAGIAEIVSQIRTAHPESKVLLLPILPTGPKPNPDGSIPKTNRIIRRLADGRNVLWLDCYENFIAPDGTVGKDILGDGVHPTAKGYEIWRDAVLPVFRQVCGPRR